MQKSNKKKLTLLAFLAAISMVPAPAQTTVTLTGIVKDAISNQPIFGALVQATPALIRTGEVVTPKLALTTLRENTPSFGQPHPRRGSCLR